MNRKQQIDSCSIMKGWQALILHAKSLSAARYSMSPMLDAIVVVRLSWLRRVCSFEAAVPQSRLQGRRTFVQCPLDSFSKQVVGGRSPCSVGG